MVPREWESAKSKWGVPSWDPPISFSIMLHNTEWSTAESSAFFAINACRIQVWMSTPCQITQAILNFIHPHYALWLRIVVTPSTELNILECTNHKILHTIQGLPIRCPVAALQSLIGCCSISSYISHWQLAFNMQASDFAKQPLEGSVVNPRAKRITATLIGKPTSWALPLLHQTAC